MSLARSELKQPHHRHPASSSCRDSNDPAAICPVITRWSTARQDQP
jgi:hypothetical protein